MRVSERWQREGLERTEPDGLLEFDGRHLMSAWSVREKRGREKHVNLGPVEGLELNRALQIS